MIHSDFVKYWRAKDFISEVPKNNKKVFERMISLLFDIKKEYGIDDIRKLDFNSRVEIVKKIFGDPEEQYQKVLNKEIENSIKVGKKRINGI